MFRAKKLLVTLQTLLISSNVTLTHILVYVITVNMLLIDEYFNIPVNARKVKMMYKYCDYDTLGLYSYKQKF